VQSSAGSPPGTRKRKGRVSGKNRALKPGRGKKGAQTEGECLIVKGEQPWKGSVCVVQDQSRGRGSRGHREWLGKEGGRSQNKTGSCPEWTGGPQIVTFCLGVAKGGGWGLL